MRALLVVFFLAGCVPTQKAFDHHREINAQQHQNVMEVFRQLGQIEPELAPFIANACRGNDEVQKEAQEPSGYDWASAIANAISIAIKQIMANLGLGTLVGGGGLMTILGGYAVQQRSRSIKHMQIAKIAAEQDPAHAKETLRGAGIA